MARTWVEDDGPDGGHWVDDAAGGAATKNIQTAMIGGRLYYVLPEGLVLAPGQPQAQPPQVTYKPAGNGLLIGSDGQYYQPGPTYNAADSSQVPIMQQGQPTAVNPSALATMGSGGPGRAPTPPVQRVDRNGDIVGYNPFTGEEQYRVPGAEYPTLSPQEQQAIKQGDIEATRRFTSGESQLERDARATENDYTRQFNRAQAERQNAFTSGENALTRAQQASEFAANFGLRQQDQKLSAAKQAAELISMTDPAALPAFLRAGGGNVSNAIASGATALSDNALLPAARTYRAIDEQEKNAQAQQAAQQNQRDSYIREHWVQTNGGTQNLPWGPQSQNRPVPQTRPFDEAMALGNTLRDKINANAAQPQSPPPVDYSDAAMQQRITASRAAGSGAGGQGTNGAPAFEPPRFAFGNTGAPATGEFISGDSTDPTNPAAGGARPELVSLNDPPGANNASADITPLTPPSGGDGIGRVAALFDAIAAFLSGGTGDPAQSPVPPLPAPRFAYGTTGFETLATPEDVPYLDQVRQQRQAVQIPNLFDNQVGNAAMNASFFQQPTSLRNLFTSAQQSRYGIDQQTQLEDARRYALQGANARGGRYAL